MIRLAGFEPGEDIEIAVTGTRPGERLHEILFAREEPRAEIGIDGVMAAKPVFADREPRRRVARCSRPGARDRRPAGGRTRVRGGDSGVQAPARESPPSQTRKSVSRRTDRLPAAGRSAPRAARPANPPSARSASASRASTAAERAAGPEGTGTRPGPRPSPGAGRATISAIVSGSGSAAMSGRRSGPGARSTASTARARGCRGREASAAPSSRRAAAARAIARGPASAAMLPFTPGP